MQTKKSLALMLCLVLLLSVMPFGVRKISTTTRLPNHAD